MLTADELRIIALEEFGIKSDAQLREELAKLSFDIGFFTEVPK